MIMDLKELLNLDKKPIFLENVNGDKLGVLNNYIQDVKFSPRFNSISTLSFKVYEDCPYYKQISSWRRIQIQDLMRFIVEKPLESNDGLRKFKEITCRSLEIDINRKTVPLLKGTYKFYSSLPEDETICSIIMSYLPNWTLESVDSELFNIYRTFDLQDRPLYQLIMEDIENAYECIFEFDTLNQKITIRVFENIPKKSDIYLSFDNLVNELNITEDTESLITSITVQGTNGLAINIVNPLGNTIYNFQHFATNEYMSEGLVTAINNWQTLINSKQVEYSDYLLQRKTKLSERITLETELVELQGQLKSLTEVRDALLDSGLDASAKNTEVRAKQTEITNKETLIKNKQTEIDNIDLALQNIQNTVSLKSYFTQSQLLELEPFIINLSITDENFTKVDTDTDLDIQETAQDLYDKYKRYLDIASKMKYKFSIDLINFISLDEYKLFTNQLQWGITVNLETESNGIAYPMLLGLDMDLDNETDVQFLFGEDLRYEDSAMSYEDYISNQLSSVSNMVTGSSIKWGEYVGSGAKDKIFDLFSKGLNLDLIDIKSATNQSIIYDSSGLYGRKIVDGVIDDEQWKFINNKLMFTDDGWNTSKLGIGLITLPSGEKAYGISTEILMGNLVASNQLVIKNANNTFTVDADSARLVNATLSIENSINKILLDPTNGFKIQKNVNTIWTDMVYIDTNGDANFKGKISASEISGSTIKGGSIYIGGNQTADNCVFGVDNVGNILGIKTFNDLFSVDVNGNVVINGGLVLGGSITWNVHDPLIADAQSTADLASSRISKLADGTYTGGTFIDGTTISSPYIEGGRISGGEFCDLYNKGKLVLNPTNSISNNADLYLYSGNNIAFKIYDNIDGTIDISSYGYDIMTMGTNGTFALGKWDFSSANVTGIVARFG